MEHLTTVTSEEEDLRVCSTKKVKMDGQTEDTMEDSTSVHLNPASSSALKPSYKDMVTSSEFMVQNPEDIVTAVSEELFPGFDDSDDDCSNQEDYNPNPEVQISLEEYQDWCKPWRDTLIVNLLGRKVSLRFMTTRLQSLWAIQGQIRVIGVNDEFFMVRFSDPGDYNHALFEGPWLITDHYLLVQRWRPRFKPARNPIKKIAVWQGQVPVVVNSDTDPATERNTPIIASVKDPLDYSKYFGPWMLAKKPQRRNFGVNKSGSNLEAIPPPPKPPQGPKQKPVRKDHPKIVGANSQKPSSSKPTPVAPSKAKGKKESQPEVSGIQKDEQIEEEIRRRRKEQEILELMRMHQKRLHDQYLNGGSIVDILGAGDFNSILLENEKKWWRPGQAILVNQLQSMLR
ncbi:hypothetical protein SESBI_08025 [Sesbania bispinosa]|nr:hypothetical protein SESBI_08025 [Sesbania bispinosa]